MAIVKDYSRVIAVFQNDDGDIVIRTVSSDANGLANESIIIDYDDLNDLRLALDEIAGF